MKPKREPYPLHECWEWMTNHNLKRLRSEIETKVRDLEQTTAILRVRINRIDGILDKRDKDGNDG